MLQGIKALLKQGPEVQLTAAALRRLEDPDWRKANSKWRWIVWLSVGLYAGPVLIVQGIRAKSKRLWIFGFLTTALLIFSLALLPQEGSETTDSVTTLLALLLLLPIIVAFWATSAFGKDVLVWKSMRDQVTGDWFSQNFGDAVKLPPSDVIEPKLSPKAVSAMQDAGLVSSTGKSDFSGNISINLAPRESLESSELFTSQQLQKILDRRSSRPIRNQEELRLLLELRPHEVVSLSKHVNFESDMEGSTGSGRVLDL